ncbi:MAG: peptidase [Patescibacteria group bacterium]|nr:MAG: peptidase [Patescibacteria group bacterium]
MNVKEYFIELVKIDSPSGTEQAIAEYLIGWLEGLGFFVQQDAIGNVFASTNVTKDSPAPLLLCAHMDTVQPGIGIKPILKNGVITSDGETILGADNKAAIAAMMQAVEVFFADPNNSKKPLEVLFTVKEETGGGVDLFNFSLPTAKTVLICDYAKPIGTVVLGAPFIQNFTVEFIGKAAHSSKPDTGRNAFLGLSEFLNGVKVGSLDAGLTTVNIGTIMGGSGVNTIPEKCTVKGEVRSFKEKLFYGHLYTIKKMAKSVAKNQGLEVTFKVDGFCPGYLYEESLEHIQFAGEIIEKVTKKKVQFERTFGVSDGNILAHAGFKAILISDGVKDPHTVHESIALKDLEMLSKVVLGFLDVNLQ